MIDYKNTVWVGIALAALLMTGCGEHPPEVKAEYGKKCRARLERTFPGAEIISYSQTVYDVPLTAYCQAVVRYEGKLYDLSYQIGGDAVDVNPLEVPNE
jgi:hypothetical protein